MKKNICNPSVLCSYYDIFMINYELNVFKSDHWACCCFNLFNELQHYGMSESKVLILHLLNYDFFALEVKAPTAVNRSMETVFRLNITFSWLIF